MLHAEPRRDLRRHVLSILYLRCVAGYSTVPAPAEETAFNSLFEMPPLCDVVNWYNAAQLLSILYLRCCVRFAGNYKRDDATVFQFSI